MKKKGLIIFCLCLGFLWVVHVLPLHAQKAPKTLTLLYSNNLNGETDPCPS
jgi:hypothetical protein